jgi:bifunctional protein TilS/HprT
MRNNKLAVNKGLIYYKTVRKAIAALDSRDQEQSLLKMVQGISRSMEAGVSLVLLDSANKKLMHHTSWGLPDAYLQKGVLDAKKSLGEAIKGQVVAVEDILHDSRVEYPEWAVQAGIASILGVPLTLRGRVIGSIRVYTRERRQFSNTDISFVTAMSRLIARDMGDLNEPKSGDGLHQNKDEGEPSGSIIQQVRNTAFAHPSEKELAKLLDFYHIEWIYEPRSFPLSWAGSSVAEMFTPDFYLPDLDLYVELTTMKQSLVTKKNRKLRRLRELYPDIKISLLYKKDFDRLLGKYGFGPLAETRSRRVEHVLFSTEEIHKRVKELADQISQDYVDSHPVMIGVLRGVFCFMADIVREMTIPLDIDFMAISYFNDAESSVVKITRDIDINVTGRPVIMVEDIVDTGMTLSYILKHLKMKGTSSLAVCTLLDKHVRRITDISLDYVGFEAPDEFLVGYGLDYKEEYRNLPYIGILSTEEGK